MKYREPFLHRYESTVSSVRSEPPYLVAEFEDTIFYPGGGGQPCDTGTVSAEGFEGRVVEARRQDARILHRILPAHGELKPGMRALQEHDVRRRTRLLMMHTGEHLLFQSLSRVVPDASVEKIQLAEESSVLFLKSSVLSWEDVFKAEQLANHVIAEDRKLSESVLSLEEAALEQAGQGLRVKLHRINSGEVRVIRIEGFDYAACAGVHAPSTGHVKSLLVTSINRVAGLYEVRFAVGVEGELFQLAESARLAASHLGTSPASLPALVASLREESLRLKGSLREFQKKAASQIEEERMGSLRLCHAVLDSVDRKQLVERAGELCRQPKTVALFLNRTGERLEVVLMSSADAGIDIPALLSSVVRELGGSGGGRDRFAMGSVTAAPERVLALLKERLSGF